MSALELIESIKDYNVLFVGDAIVDEYHYVTSLSKTPKEHLIPVAFNSSEIFAGGVDAAAAHLRSFCASVTVCKNGGAIHKVRFVDKLYTRKLFEVHYQEEVNPDYSAIDGDYDAVVVTDFGHGQICSDTIERLKSMPFVAINAQTNSANYGYNLITKYSKADYIVIDEPEARLAAADRTSPIEDVILKLSDGRCNKFVVTHGSNGAIGYDGAFHRCPAFTDRVVDTMGAGDAFFAVTAPMARRGEMADLLRIGNAAGALKTQIVGHRRSITKDELIEFLRTH